MDKYIPGSHVWVRKSRVWWPACIVDVSVCPLATSRCHKNRPHVYVRYLYEDKFDCVYNEKSLCFFDCVEKKQIMRKTQEWLRKHNDTIKMLKFQKTISMLEDPDSEHFKGFSPGIEPNTSNNERNINETQRIGLIAGNYAHNEVPFKTAEIDADMSLIPCNFSTIEDTTEEPSGLDNSTLNHQTENSEIDNITCKNETSESATSAQDLLNSGEIQMTNNLPDSVVPNTKLATCVQSNNFVPSPFENEVGVSSIDPCARSSVSDKLLLITSQNVSNSSEVQVLHSVPDSLDPDSDLATCNQSNNFVQSAFNNEGSVSCIDTCSCSSDKHLPVTLPNVKLRNCNESCETISDEPAALPSDNEHEQKENQCTSTAEKTEKTTTKLDITLNKVTKQKKCRKGGKRKQGNSIAVSKRRKSEPTTLDSSVDKPSLENDFVPKKISHSKQKQSVSGDKLHKKLASATVSTPVKKKRKYSIPTFSPTELIVVDKLNKSSIEFNMQQAELTSGDESEDELPEAFSPSVQALGTEFSKGDIVWASFRKTIYWPALIKYVYTKRKKVAKVALYFINDTLTKNQVLMGYEPKKENIVPYNDDKRSIFKENGSSSDRSEEFLLAVDAVDDFLNKKALKHIDMDSIDYFKEQGLLPSNFCSNTEICLEEPMSDEDTKPLPESNNLGDPEDAIEVIYSTIQISTVSRRNREELEMQHAKRKIRNQDLVNFITTEPVKEYLYNIYQKKVKSECHDAFLSDPKSARCLGSGPIDDEEQFDEIVKVLNRWYTSLPKGSNNDAEEATINSTAYVVDVWFPEAVVYALRHLRKYTRKKAWEMFRKGVRITKASSSVMHEQILNSVDERDMERHSKKIDHKIAEMNFQMLAKLGT